MPLPQMRLVAAAKKHGAVRAGASAMHGWARFETDIEAEAFATIMLQQQWSVMIYPQNGGKVIAVDWTAERMANGHVTPIRSESKA